MRIATLSFTLCVWMSMLVFACNKKTAEPAHQQQTAPPSISQKAIEPGAQPRVASDPIPTSSSGAGELQKALGKRSFSNEAGAACELDVKTIDDRKMIFDLLCTMPDSHTGEIEGGEAQRQGGSGPVLFRFSQTEEGLEPCILTFTLEPKSSIRVRQTGAESSCGFGAGVSAEGLYEKK